MQTADIELMIDYNYWANAQVLAAAARLAPATFVVPATSPTRTVRDALVHQLDVEWSWRLRWEGRGEVDELNANEFATVEQLGARWREDEQAMRAHIATLRDADLTRSVASGGSKPLPVWVYIVHVINHGTQQRADAALLLTVAGYSPGDLDLADFLPMQPG